MFLKVDHSKNQPNMKTRLKVSTKYILRNALNKKKPICSYISLIFSKSNFNENNAILITILSNVGALSYHQR